MESRFCEIKMPCSGWKLETNLSIGTLDSMFGHKRLLWLFEFIFIMDSMTGCNNVSRFLYLFCSDKLLQRALTTTRKT